MDSFKLLSAIAFAELAGCAAAAPLATRTQVANSNNFATRIVAAHNRERAAVGAAPLTWDPMLEAGAASYARGLALTGRFAHSDRASRGGAGENLWMGTRGAYSLEQMIGSWVSEKAMFVRGVFPRVSRNGNWAAVGHYSQMIWPTTTRIGCALGSNRAADYLVCRYSPAGNIDGRRVP
ncbi:CAP domain-containing protein [Sphingomonas sp. URHD0057]|uniref:CAP domain-containing protein n=1 Tax=Sphingomonas sp. URHD0057 TaxID=1380389 RepID=UPI0005614ABC|nr:CAP domain-containing protein [Sphingomonas sp. URHD0057]